MNASIRGRLSVMMFLQYVIWGAWLPLISPYMRDYLHFTPAQQTWINGAFAVAAITAWLFGGQMADRYFEQSKFLAFSHLVGGLAMLNLAYTRSYWPMLGLMMLHCFFYVPTLSMTNSIAFANLKDPQKDFGFVRLFGTLGWIAASWPYVFLLIDWSAVPEMGAAGGFVAWLGKALGTPLTGAAMETGLRSMFFISGGTSLLLAAFCLTLPKTPPAANADAASAPLASLRLLAVPAIFVLFVATFLDSVVHYCYFIWSGTFFKSLGLPENWVTPAMSVGQIAEIPAMALLGYFLKRLGWRTVMILGMLAQALRFGIYYLAAGQPDLLWLAIFANVVHGFAYAFFFATVYIFVDESFPKDVRTSAQTLFNLVILGIGSFAASALWPVIGQRVTTGVGDAARTDFAALFLWPAGMGLAAAVVLALFFHPPRSVAKPTSEPADELEPSVR